MVSFSFADTIKMLQQTGVYDYVLPFLLVFAIIFAVLEKTKVLGEKRSNINGLVAFVIGLILIAQQGVVQIINRFLPRVSLILVVILMILVVIATIMGKEYKGFKGAWLGLFVLLGIGAVLVAALTGSGTSWLSQQDRETLLTIGIPLIALALIFWFVTRPPQEEKKESSAVKLLKSLGDSLEK